LKRKENKPPVQCPKAFDDCIFNDKYVTDEGCSILTEKLCATKKKCKFYKKAGEIK
jgi:hypothetical protein